MNLTSIGNDLLILGNIVLSSLTGLENITAIQGDVSIDENLTLSNLEGLSGLASIGGNLYIGYNSSLTNLTGLENLASIGYGLYIYYNSALVRLTGINNIDGASIHELHIYNNGNLSACDVESICDFLSNPPQIVYILDNAPGCNSPEEVEAACNEVSTESIGFVDNYLLFPNPSDKTVIISGNNGISIREIIIYNQTGQKVQQGKPENNTLDISKLQPGMYIIELLTDQGKVRKKLIIE